MCDIKSAFNVNGTEAKLITLKNRNGMTMKLLSYGASMVELLVPDRDGRSENIILTHDHLEDYVKNPSYFGATVGRTAGRIAKGVFSLDGQVYGLNKNYGVNHGHGGPTGFSFRMWDFEPFESGGKAGVTFSYASMDMEEGYPGNVKAKVIYTLTDHNTVVIEYEAASDKKTLCNLTNHAYFNLSGHYRRKVTGQCLKIRSDRFLELDRNQVPTGRYLNVRDTPMDFNEYKLIGRDIESSYEQLRLTSGYDHAWMLRKADPQLEMLDEQSGREMAVATSYPCVVIYSYNFPGGERLKYGGAGRKYDGICFETQYEPDGIHHEDMNHAVLEAGRQYYEKTEYRFSVMYR